MEIKYLLLFIILCISHFLVFFIGRKTMYVKLLKELIRLAERERE